MESYNQNVFELKDVWTPIPGAHCNTVKRVKRCTVIIKCIVHGGFIFRDQHPPKEKLQLGHGIKLIIPHIKST